MCLTLDGNDYEKDCRGRWKVPVVYHFGDEFVWPGNYTRAQTIQLRWESESELNGVGAATGVRIVFQKIDFHAEFPLKCEVEHPAKKESILFGMFNFEIIFVISLTGGRQIFKISHWQIFVIKLNFKSDRAYNINLPSVRHMNTLEISKI